MTARSSRRLDLSLLTRTRLPRDSQSEVVIADARERQVRLQLRSGGARFDVTPNPERRFRVAAGPVSVEVLGTEFDCQRLGDRVMVQVIRGVVEVSWADGSVRLRAGESGVFPPEVEGEGVASFASDSMTLHGDHGPPVTNCVRSQTQRSIQAFAAPR